MENPPEYYVGLPTKTIMSLGREHVDLVNSYIKTLQLHIEGCCIVQGPSPFDDPPLVAYPN